MLLPLLLLPACRLNAFNYNKLLPRTTTGAALMQNGSLMARFAAPTCWNLLHMAHMDGRLDEAGTTTVFTQVRRGRPVLCCRCVRACYCSMCCIHCPAEVPCST